MKLVAIAIALAVLPLLEAANTSGAGGSPSLSRVALYVSPDGDDSWSGMLPAPNASKTDGPFATFDHARVYVQGLPKAGLNQIVVQFRGRTYPLSSAVQFTSADSGTAATEIIYQNYPGEAPVFSGGVRVQNWTNLIGNEWKTTLPSGTQYFENLFYNGERRLRPRVGGYLGTYYRVASSVYVPTQSTALDQENCPVLVSGNGYECFDRFQYDPSDPMSGTWLNLTPSANNGCGQPAGNAAIAGDIEVLIFEQFSASKLRVSCVDTTNHIVYMTGRTGINKATPSQDGFITGNRYLVENVEDRLSVAGQWFLDRSVTPWTLSYLANPGENPNMDTVVMPQAPQLLTATGLTHVTFEGLTFEYDNFTISATGHAASELEPEISAAVSFQNSQYITFDSGVVRETSGSGLEFISCLSTAQAPAYCISRNANAATSNDVVSNSAFYDIGVLGIRIGEPFANVDSDANVPHEVTVFNSVVEGYGRTIPSSFGIGQGDGHHNLYTHNDVYDGYHTAVSISEAGGDTVKPSGMGNAYNTISFNHVWNLFQGIMNDGGAIRIEAGNEVYTAPGNRILNNRIHDVSDASVLDSNGYGGHGVYLDNQTGLVDVENNLVYRVSGFPVYTPQGPAAPDEANTVQNNILAFGRQAMAGINFPYPYGVTSSAVQNFVITSNLFYFDRSNASSPKFWLQGGCTYAGGFPFVQFQLWDFNLYWRVDGAFATDTKAFHVQPSPGTGPNAPCNGNTSNWTFYDFAHWQQAVGEDTHSVVRDPGFKNPVYPADDYSLPNGSPLPSFVIFDPNEAGRFAAGGPFENRSPAAGFLAFDARQSVRPSAQANPPPVPAGFPTQSYNPASDF